MKKTQKGFSLIELLIVVAIILIIAAIAIPNLLRSRIAANEASAVGSIRTINTAEVTYASSYPDCGFTTLANLGGAGGTSTGAGLIDAVLAAGTKSGYSFAATASAGNPGTCGGSTPSTGTPYTSYTVVGAPISVGQTGQRYFYSDQSGVIRYDPLAAATAASNPLQ
jgi:type IV pilus assembly protein PilA